MEKEYISAIEANAQKDPSFVILKGKKTDGWYDVTWGKLWQDIQDLGQSLVSIGVKEEDKIVIFSQNKTQWITTDLATMAIRGVTVPVYATSSHGQLSYIIKETEAKIIFVGSQYQYDTTVELYGRGDIDVDKIVVYDASVQLVTPNSVYYSDFIHSGKDDVKAKEEFSKRRKESSLTDLATIIYTSGTTGEPKGVMIGQDTLMQAMKIHNIRIQMSTQDVSLCFLPLCHVFERGWTWYCMYRSSQVYVLTDTKTIGETLPEVAPTAFCSVPRIYEKMYQKINANVLSGFRVKRWAFNLALSVGRRYNEATRLEKEPKWWIKALYAVAETFVFKTVKAAIGGRLRMMPTAGAHVPYFIVDFFHAMGIHLKVGYGLTETCATVSACPDTMYELGSVGTPFPEVEVKIGAENEILVRSKTVMRGYYKKPQATAEAIDADGWFHTGDAGMLDEHGNLFITDRIKDLMKTSQGKYIAPQMIETRLTSDVFIEQAVVVGDQKPYVTAFVVPNFEALKNYAASAGITFKNMEELVNKPSIRQMYEKKIADLQKGFAGFEMIKRFTLLAKEFSMDAGELTPTLKVRRKIILERLAPQIAMMYASNGFSSGSGEK
ncbi:MAG: long-chain fatty acid--CoA ligase [Flavobacteriales bacterium]|nr:long-chain fatty acid--CoA ligase [Flavobacteriales bacterium]